MLYDQGSRPIVGYDGTVYVIFDGATRLATLDSTYIVKSTDGGVTWSKPTKVADVQDAIPIANTVFRVNSFPAGQPQPNGDLYVAWSSQTSDSTGGCARREPTPAAIRRRLQQVDQWRRDRRAPVPILPARCLDPDGNWLPGNAAGRRTLNAPAARRVDTLWPGVAVSPSGRVYMSAYGADVVRPGRPAPQGRRRRWDGSPATLGDYIDNARLDYYVTNVGSGSVQKVSTHPINTRNGFGGGFIGDYTEPGRRLRRCLPRLLDRHNNKQTVVWFYGIEFIPTFINQEDVVTASGSF